MLSKISTVIICVIIICFFVYGIVYLLKIRLDSKTIKKILKKYKNTLIDGKTTSYAEDFFDEEEIFHLLGINTKMLHAMAGTLVGIGVMGTFLGLTIGLYGVNLDATATEMQKSINSLLGGMTTAFWTSLFGMFFSIVYTCLEKYVLNKFAAKISRICNKLNKKYYIRPEEQMKRQIMDLYESNFKIVDDQGKELHYGDVIRRIKEDIERLATSADNINETVLINITNKAISENLKPVLSEVQQLSLVLSQKLDDLGSRVEKPGEDIIENISNRLESIIKQFGDNIKAASASTITELKKNAENTSNLLNETTENLTNFSKSTKEYSDSQKSNIEYMLKTINEAMRELKEKTTETVNAISKESQKTITMANGVMSSFKEIMVGIHSAINGTKEVLEEINVIKDEFSITSENLGEASKKTAEVVNYLSQSQKEFSEQCKDNITMQNSATVEIQKTVKDIEHFSEEYVKKFEGIENSLQSVFGAIQSSIQDYTRTVGDNMTNLLKGYADHTSGAIKELGGVVDALKDVLEEISENRQGQKVKFGKK